jgi:hypothetical protein
MPRVAEAMPKASMPPGDQQPGRVAEALDHGVQQGINGTGAAQDGNGATDDQHEKDDALGIFERSGYHRQQR